MLRLNRSITFASYAHESEHAFDRVAYSHRFEYDSTKRANINTSLGDHDNSRRDNTASYYCVLRSFLSGIRTSRYDVCHRVAPALLLNNRYCSVSAHADPTAASEVRSKRRARTRGAGTGCGQSQESRNVT